MSEKNYYLILQLEPDATSEQIRRAYKRLAKVHHPDREGGSSRKFRELNTAYEVLSNPQKRRDYNSSIHIEKPPSESIISDAPVDLSLDFDTHLPSLGDLLDFMFGRSRGGSTKSSRNEHLRVEVILTPYEARMGGVLPIEVPVATDCPRCGGSGSIFHFYCPLCDGSGGIESRRSLPVNIPPGIRDRTTFDYDLSNIDLPDTILHIKIRVQ